MVGVVNVGWGVDVADDIVADDGARLISQGIDTSHIVHMSRIMMDEIMLHPIVVHTHQVSVPSPSKADSRVGNITNLIMADVCLRHISSDNGHTPPVVVGDISE